MSAPPAPRPTLLNTSALSGSTPVASASALGSTPLTPQSQFDRRRNAIDNGRNLVICFDGTANEFTDANTNIVKLFTFLEKESPEQLCYYQTGVGTTLPSGITGPISTWFGKAADLGVAAFLDEHVMGGYRFLQSTYNQGDRIYLFGFSRGAYTARALAGMLYTVGLLPRAMPEQVPFAYEIFKKGKESTAYKRAFSRTVTIEFIGVFDTVSSVGAVFPKVLPFSSDNHITKTFRHALALDEHRAKFRSNPWHLTVNPEIEDDRNEPHSGVIRTTLQHLKKHHHEETEDQKIASDEDRKELDHEFGLDRRPPTDVKEVWFAGCHCDVGGGNAKDSDPHALANIPLKWMLKEIIAADTGLIFRRSALARAHIDLDELVEAAERTKIEDAKHKVKVKEASAASARSGSGTDATSTVAGTSPTATLKLSLMDGEAAVPVLDMHNGSVKNPAKAEVAEAEHEITTRSLYERWKTGSGKRDAECELTDELYRAPAWWLLECIPFVDSNQDQHGHWKDSVRVNLFRPRNIPYPPDHSNPNSRYNPSNKGVSITDAPALFHISVKHRMEAEECKVPTWRSFWRRKDTNYRPRAWPPAGDPVYVE